MRQLIVGRTGFCRHPWALLQSIAKDVDIDTTRELGPPDLVIDIDETARRQSPVVPPVRHHVRSSALGYRPGRAVHGLQASRRSPVGPGRQRNTTKEDPAVLYLKGCVTDGVAVAYTTQMLVLIRWRHRQASASGAWRNVFLVRSRAIARLAYLSRLHATTGHPGDIGNSVAAVLCLAKASAYCDAS